MISIDNEKSLKKVNCQFCYSSTMEEAFSFHVMSRPDIHPICSGWVMHIHDNLPEKLRDEIDECGREYGFWLYVLDILGSIVEERANYECDLPLIREKIFAMPDMQFVYYILGLCETRLQVSMDLFAEWYPDEDVCRTELQKRGYSCMQMDNALAILRDVEGFKRKLVRILEEYWEVAFSREWSSIRDYVQDIIYHEQLSLSHMSLMEYLSQFHNQLKIRDGKLILDLKSELSIRLEDIEYLYVTPSIFGDDHLHGNISGNYVNITLNLNYRALQLNRAVPDAYFQMLRVLSDESRFKVLKVLWNGEATTKEISDILRLSPSTISIHLKLLKEADLVTSKKVKKYVYYRIKKDRLLTLQEETLNYLQY